MRVMLERKSDMGSTLSTKQCCPKFPIIIPKRIMKNGSISTKTVGRVFSLAARYIKPIEEHSDTNAFAARSYFLLRKK